MNTMKLLNLILALALVMLTIVFFRMKSGKSKELIIKKEEKMPEQKKRSEFKEIDIRQLNENVVKLFDDDWFLLTAGSEGGYNPMTISWGNIGNLWNYPMVTVYVRHNRYTFGFMENARTFTLCAFDEDYRDMLNYMGTVSGRDEDKIKNSGLTPVISVNGSMYFEEARLVIEAEKIYSDDFELEKILDDKAKGMYEDGSIHRMYFGKILKVWIKE